MQVFSHPIVAEINPPDLLSGMPGEQLLLSVVIHNQGLQGAVIDVFLDDADEVPKRWCASARQRLSLGAAQSDEIVFEFTIPIDAPPGTYDYALVVDAPEHYPEDTPIQFPQRLRVQIKEQTVVRVNDPSFFLIPATNSEKPARLKQGDRLMMQVRVENRSNLVDRFRLVCQDLEEDWFTIRYPSNTPSSFGVLSEPTCLELNPGKTGLIQLELHPPSSAFAGMYSPTFRLYSDNQPDLVSLDLVYLELQPATNLHLDLETIVGKVSQNPGQYQLTLQNPGNVIRQLSLSASSRDEEELCRYDYDPQQVRLLPSREVQVMLQVVPIHRWRRPWIGTGQVIPFQVGMRDAQGYELPDRLPEGTLTWKARPWWQLLLLLLAIGGAIATIALLIWFFFLRAPAKLEIGEFEPDQPAYTEDDKVRLRWTIKNAKQLQKIDLKTVNAGVFFPKSYSIGSQQQLPEELQKCEFKQQDLVCAGVLIGALAPDTYNFELRATAPNQQAATTTQVKVNPKPDPKVLSFKSDRSDYKAGQPVLLSWAINNVGQLKTLRLVTKDQDKKAIDDQQIFDQAIVEKFKPVCQSQSTTLTCTKVQIAPPKSGTYTFELLMTTKRDKAIEPAASSPISIAARPLEIVSFTLDGKPAPNTVNLKIGQSFTLSWQVDGGEGKVLVSLSLYGDDFAKSDSYPAPGFPTPGEKTIQITAKDEKGQTVSGKKFTVNVIAPPSPSPSPSAPVVKPSGSSQPSNPVIAPSSNNPSRF